MGRLESVSCNPKGSKDVHTYYTLLYIPTIYIPIIHYYTYLLYTYLVYITIYEVSMSHGELEELDGYTGYN